MGLLLVLPAVVALIVGYAWPTIRTGWLSLRDSTPLRGTSTFVGLDNYEQVTSAPWASGSFGLALSIAFPLLLVLAVVAPLLALAAHHAGRAGRLAVRLALTVPMVCFVPAGIALGWRFDRITATPEDMPGDVRAAIWLGMFGLICGIGVTFYLAAFRRDQRGTGWPWAAAGVVAGLAVLAAIAVGLQAFTYPFLMSGGTGGPANSTRTPMFDAYRYGLNNFEFGAGNAAAMLILVVLMLLGIGAALLVILTGLRVEVAPASDRTGGWDGARVAAVVGTVVLLAGVLAITAYGLWPWLSRLGFGDTDRISVPSMLARTWLPPMVSTVVGVGLAAVAAFGIGALRPLGRWSELLLLPFAPWLFVGVGPLFITKYGSAAFGTVERVNNVLGWIPPIWLVVPALFLFTLLFRGMAGAGARYGQMALWALPLVAVVGVATWLVQSQSLLWGLIISTDPDGFPAPVWARVQFDASAVSADDIGFGLVLPVPLIVILGVGLALLHVFYLDRLAIRVGNPRYAGDG